MVCRELGYIGGSVFTFGVSASLPELPIVAGFRLCVGDESDLWDCPLCGEQGTDANGQCNGWAGHPADPTGVNGVDPDCNHAIVSVLPVLFHTAPGFDICSMLAGPRRDLL